MTWKKKRKEKAMRKNRAWVYTYASLKQKEYDESGPILLPPRLIQIFEPSSARCHCVYSIQKEKHRFDVSKS